MGRAYTAFEAEDWPLAGELLATAAPSLTGEMAAATWFDAALAYKFARDWPRAYETGKIAVTHVRRGAEEPAFWNLGTVATILGDWATARDCWDGYGLSVPPGSGPINEDFGPTCVRLRDVGEVVWALRLCPTRARVISVPFDPSRRFGEVVVHDGAPNGERTTGDLTVPVFDELVLAEESPLATLSVLVNADQPADLHDLQVAFSRRSLGIEILASRVDLCTCCSESSIRQESRDYANEQRLFLGATQDDARTLLEEWAGAAPTARTWANLHPA
ncbi:hypothetical protein GCM10010435_73230 [Winogradskya consettensis]|uniref:Tetratricopeptide repeat protein n=2 Tax=Winogradskya consettensis TaxID=113560 RepID=A0A919SQI8_9ACTN|nr:hypothetical protein Aco04nite_44350 [Actinoplanes consettensis]